jgi:hypothetical protein
MNTSSAPTDAENLETRMGGSEGLNRGWDGMVADGRERKYCRSGWWVERKGSSFPRITPLLSFIRAHPASFAVQHPIRFSSAPHPRQWTIGDSARS